jgi:DNA polymerase-3 subunit alpha
VDGRQINRKVLESLIGAGALDCLGGHRAQFMAMIDGFMSASQRGAGRGKEQCSMFDSEAISMGDIHPALPEVSPSDPELILRRERELLGFYVSGHPLDSMRNDIETLTQVKLGEKEDLIDGDIVRIGGLVAAVRRVLTKRGNPMATVTLEDFTGSADVLVFGDALEASSPLLNKDNVILIVARVSAQEDKEPKFIAQEVYTLEQAKIQFARGLFITLADRYDEDTLNGLEDIFLHHHGEVPIYFRVVGDDGKTYLLRSRRYRLKTSEEVIRLMQAVIGNGRIQVSL